MSAGKMVAISKRLSSLKPSGVRELFDLLVTG
jgi:hypothetical protein